MNWRWIPVTLVGVMVLCTAALVTVIVVDLRDRGLEAVIGSSAAQSMGAGQMQPRSYASGNNPIRIMLLDTPEDGDTTDVLEVVNAMNGPDAPPLPTSFGPRTSHVTSAPAPRPFGDGGYTIQLASQSPVGTPKVHGGRVYVDGGFNSYVGYAFDASSGSPVWAVTMDDGGPSAADADDDLCVFNTESCSIFAFDANTGRMRWAYWLADPQISRPALAGDLVISSYPHMGGLHMNYTFDTTQDDRHITATHAVVALDRRDGSIRWQKWIDGDIMTQPVPDLDRNVLHFATFSGTVYQIDMATGDFVAAHANRATSAPVPSDQRLYYTAHTRPFGEEPVEAIVVDDARTGDRIATFAAADAPHLDPQVQRRTNYANQGRVLDAGNGFGDGAPPATNADVAFGNIGLKSVATLQTYEGARPTLSIDGERAFLTRGDRVVCVDLASGAEVWSHAVEGNLRREGGMLATPPAAAGDAVVFGTLGGQLIHLDAQTGDVVGRARLGQPLRSKPTLAAGNAYVGTETGSLIMLPLAAFPR
ncbi:MAG: PQQ-binding-like beta-propeller repeat protein [Planctomycetota bacterium]